jgi:threonine synthase
MELYSTKHISPNVDLEEAVFRGLPPDNGLYVPVSIPKLPKDFFDSLDSLSFSEIAFQVTKALLSGSLSDEDIKAITSEAVNFDAPLVNVEKNIYSMELFHGPSLAFKDFGARFMARLMSHYLRKSNKEINILVATSGDTGGAVALGFLNVPGVKVTILYPSGKVSTLQEKQLTALGNNISALEVLGTFDDCQRMVKEAFLDKELNEKLNLSSANSINIARLIPQSFYYFYAYSKLKSKGLPIVFSVPSGNFGNLSAGLIAFKMGLPVHHFVASTNVNDIIPKYLETGKYEPRPSIQTLSNAMDVGNPSNYQRIQALFGEEYSEVTKNIKGFSFTDKETKDAIRTVFERTGYIMCPHTAIAYLGLKKYQQTDFKELTGVFLSTAHPAKFIDVLDQDIAARVEIPASLLALADKPKVSEVTEAKFEKLKSYLLRNK